MFLPKNDNTIAQDRSAEQARREGYANIESWVIEAIPVEIRRGVTVSVQEVVCGDPECAPIDVAVCILFPRCVSIMFLLWILIIAMRERDTPFRNNALIICSTFYLCWLTS